jgi:hypothetical protein
LELSDIERAELKALTLRRKTGQALALRARIILACAQGKDVDAENFNLPMMIVDR